VQQIEQVVEEVVGVYQIGEQELVIQKVKALSMIQTKSCMESGRPFFFVVLFDQPPLGTW